MIRRSRKEILDQAALWTGEKKYRINNLLKNLITRSKELGLVTKEKEADVKQLFCSERGEFIISQALAVAIDTLKKVEPEWRRENSNTEDMEELHEILFPMYTNEILELKRVAH